MSVNRIETIVEQHEINKLKEEGRITQGEVVVLGNSYKYEFTCKLICTNYSNIRSIESVKVSVELEKEGEKYVLISYKV